MKGDRRCTKERGKKKKLLGKGGASYLKGGKLSGTCLAEGARRWKFEAVESYPDPGVLRVYATTVVSGGGVQVIQKQKTNRRSETKRSYRGRVDGRLSKKSGLPPRWRPSEKGARKKIAHRGGGGGGSRDPNSSSQQPPESVRQTALRHPREGSRLTRSEETNPRLKRD